MHYRFWVPVAVLLCAIVVCAGVSCRGQAQTAAAAPVSAQADAPRLAQAQAAEPAPRPRMLWMVAVGDIMLDRTVGKRIRANGTKSILAKVRAQTRAPYLSFANLECPLSETGPHDPANCCFRADPKTVEVITDGGFDIVSLANNHSLNAGREGVLNTLDCLEDNNVSYVGAARDRERAWEPVFFHVDGVKVGFLAYTDLSFEHGSYCRFTDDPQKCLGQIRRTKERCDLLFVSVHWGEEYQSRRSDRQRKTALAMVDAGADCILGHHPHTLQGIGVHKGKPILYSMGNFVFDQREGERMESAIFELWWKQGGTWQIKATPIWIERSRMGPIYPERGRALKIAKRLQGLSADLGAKAQVMDGKVVVRIEGSSEGGGEESVSANPQGARGVETTGAARVPSQSTDRAYEE